MQHPSQIAFPSNLHAAFGWRVLFQAPSSTFCETRNFSKFLQRLSKSFSKLLWHPETLLSRSFSKLLWHPETFPSFFRGFPEAFPSFSGRHKLFQVCLPGTPWQLWVGCHESQHCLCQGWEAFALLQILVPLVWGLDCIGLQTPCMALFDDAGIVVKDCHGTMAECDIAFPSHPAFCPACLKLGSKGKVLHVSHDFLLPFPSQDKAEHMHFCHTVQGRQCRHILIHFQCVVPVHNHNWSWGCCSLVLLGLLFWDGWRLFQAFCRGITLDLFQGLVGAVPPPWTFSKVWVVPSPWTFSKVLGASAYLGMALLFGLVSSSTFLGPFFPMEWALGGCFGSTFATFSKGAWAVALLLLLLLDSSCSFSFRSFSAALALALSRSSTCFSKHSLEEGSQPSRKDHCLMALISFLAGVVVPEPEGLFFLLKPSFGIVLKTFPSLQHYAAGTFPSTRCFSFQVPVAGQLVLFQVPVAGQLALFQAPAYGSYTYSVACAVLLVLCA